MPRSQPSISGPAQWVVWTTLLAGLPTMSSPAVGQTNDGLLGFPFADQQQFDPGQFYEQLFGDTEEDRAAIQKIDIPVQEERRIGQRAVDAYLAELRRQRVRFTARGRDVEYLKRLVATIRPHMQHAERYPRIRVYVVQSERTDARSFPGGTLFFYRGLLDFAESEAALVGAVGHELSHLDRQHQLYDAKRMKLAQKTVAGGQFSPQQFFRSGTMLMRSFSRPFRPEEEAEADEDGAKWAWQSGYEPREMARLFLRMHERDQATGQVGLPFLRSHPYHVERYQAILDQRKKLQGQQPREQLYTGYENLRQRIPRSQKVFDE